MKNLILKNARIVSSTQEITRGWIEIVNQKIKSIHHEEYQEIPNNETEVIDCLNQTIIPGFIDIHCHGGYGYSFLDRNLPLDQILSSFSKKVLQEGVTSYCVGTVASKKEDIDNFCLQLAKYLENDQKYAQVMGSYLEGPFISKKYKGAHDESLLVNPNYERIKEWKKMSNNAIKFVAYAPELDEKFGQYLLAEKITPSFAHSSADYYQTKQAIANGIRNVTHFYNAMTPFNHRKPGAVPAILFDDKVSVELICDGVHVNEDILKLTYNVKGADKIIAITDAVEAKGNEDGLYKLGNLIIRKQGNKVTLENEETIAGSVATMIDSFKRLLTITNNNWIDCVKMTSLNAAKSLNLTNIGDIKKDNIADLLVLNENNEIFLTIKQGNVVYQGSE